MKTLDSSTTRFMIVSLTVVLLIEGCAASSDRERSVCGGFLEPLAFALWAAMAPAPDERRLAGIGGVDAYQFVAGDGSTLRGYLIRARDADERLVEDPDGYVLIVPGNAMAATHVAADFAFLSALGHDVYILDYRGYADSDGKRRLLALMADYKELVAHLSAKYTQTYLLGMSMGGIVVLKAISEGATYTRAIVDSSPSTVTQFLCPKAFNPVDNLPRDASNLLIITAGRDRVIRPTASAELVTRARAAGARTFHCAKCRHPLADSEPQLRTRRFREIARFFSRADAVDRPVIE